MSKASEAVIAIKLRAAKALPAVDAKQAAAIERVQTAGSTTAKDEVGCLWIGAHVALLYEAGSSYWASIGRQGYAPSKVKLVPVSTREFPYGVQRTLWELWDPAGIRLVIGRIEVGLLWKGAKGSALDAKTLQRLAQEALVLDGLYQKAVDAVAAEQAAAEAEVDAAENVRLAEFNAATAEREEAVKIAQLLVAGNEAAIADPASFACKLAEIVLKRGLR